MRNASTLLLRPESTTVALADVAAPDRDDGETQILRIVEVCERAARGDFEARVLRCDGRSSLGRLGIAVNDLLDRADGFIREAAAALDCAAHDKFFRRVLLNGMVGSYLDAARVINDATTAMATKSEALTEAQRRDRRLADDFEQNVAGVVRAVAASATAMRESSVELAGLAGETAQAAADGSAAAVQTAAEVKHVGSVAASLTESGQAVESRVTHSRGIAVQAVAEADRTGDLVDRLNQANQRIGEVVSLIADIARQTNLLSLNASIEAARAGDAGRGFSVVALEVRKLADETAGATKRISKEIGAVQTAAEAAAVAMRSIGGTIRQLDAAAQEIGVAVQRQMERTADMQQRLDVADTCVAQVTSTIDKAGRTADRTNSSSEQMHTAADAVSRQIGDLDRSVATFLGNIRRAT